jgi:hypothetical protein
MRRRDRDVRCVDRRSQRGRLLGPVHDLRVHLRPVVHRRHGLRGGDFGQLLRGQPPVRRLGDQRQRGGAIQPGRRHDTTRVGRAGALRLPMRRIVWALLPEWSMHGGVLLGRGYPACLRRRTRFVCAGYERELPDAWSGGRLRLFRRGVLSMTIADGQTVPRG